MKKLFWIMGGLGLTGILGVITWKHASYDVLMDVTTELAHEATEEELAAKDAIALADKRLAEEKSFYTEMLDTFKNDSGYNDKRRDIFLRKTDALAREENIADISTRRAELEASMAEHISKWKADHNYDDVMAKAKKKISEAKHVYERTAVQLDSLDPDMSDMVLKIKHEAEEIMNDKVEKQQSKMDALEDELKAFTKSEKKLVTDEISALEKKTAEIRAKINDEFSEELRALEKTLEPEKEHIRKELISKRTAEEAVAIYNRDVNLKVSSDFNKQREEEVFAAFDALSPAEVWGRWFKAKKVHKSTVLFIGSLPVAVICWGGYNYILFLKDVLKSMS